MEKEFTIKASDNKTIYGKLRGSLTKPLIISVHGLGGLMDEALHYNAARYFEKHGFASFRFNQYGEQKDARRMRNGTLKSQAKDLDTVVKYFRRKGVKKIFVIGHSYGAPTIMHSDHQFVDGIVFWDGSFTEGLSKYFLKYKYNSSIKGRAMDWGFDVVIGEKMVQEALKVNTLKLIKQIRKPILFAQAGNGELVGGGKKMYSSANQPKKMIIIKKADHNFNVDGTQEELYKATTSWLKGIK